MPATTARRRARPRARLLDGITVSDAASLDIRYDVGEGPRLLGRRMRDLHLVTTNGPVRVFTLLNDARPVLLELGDPGSIDITRWIDWVQLIDAEPDGVGSLLSIVPYGSAVRP